MLNIKKAIFVAPHPDDETLGCGGSIQKLKENDCEIFWIIVTKGYEKDGFDINDIKLKEKQVDKVKSLYSFNDTFKLDLRSTMLDCYSLREIIIPLKNIFDSPCILRKLIHMDMEEKTDPTPSRPEVPNTSVRS